MVILNGLVVGVPDSYFIVHLWLPALLLFKLGTLLLFACSTAVTTSGTNHGYVPSHLDTISSLDPDLDILLGVILSFLWRKFSHFPTQFRVVGLDG